MTIPSPVSKLVSVILSSFAGAVLGGMAGIWFLQGVYTPRDGFSGVFLAFLSVGLLLGAFLGIRRTPVTDTLRTLFHAALVYPLVWLAIITAIAPIRALLHGYDSPFYNLDIQFYIAFLHYGGLAFLLLHLSSLVGVWVLLQNRRTPNPPLVGMGLSLVGGFVLRFRFNPYPDYGNGEFFVFCLIACVVSGGIAGGILQRGFAETRQATSTTIAATVTAGVLLSGFLYYYLVNPGRYITHDKGYMRMDWLTGHEESTGPG